MNCAIKEPTMKTALLATICFSLTMAAALPAKAALSVKTEVAQNADPTMIAPKMHVWSNTIDPVDISGLVMYYFFHEEKMPVGWPLPTPTPSNASMQVMFLDKTYTTSSGKHANYLVQITLPPNSWASSTQPFDVSFTLQATDARNLNQTDDWSYMSNTSPMDNPNITIQLGPGNPFTIWGNKPTHDRGTQLSLARQKIQHVIVIMQENRSFDNYFGSFPNPPGTGIIRVRPDGGLIPGVDGISNIPAGNRTGCDGASYSPFTQTATTNVSGQTQVLYDLPHYMETNKIDIGCPSSDPTAPTRTCSASGPVYIKDFLKANATGPSNVGCHANANKQTVGHYDGSAVGKPLYNYWTIAKNFALQDAMFEPVPSWSKVSHVFMVSGWSANCATAPCSPSNENYDGKFDHNPLPATYGWTEVTNLFRNFTPAPTWAYYNAEKYDSNCSVCQNGTTDQIIASCLNQSDAILPFWSPLTVFKTLQNSQQMGNVKGGGNSAAGLTAFLNALKGGTLPQVSWIVPGEKVSEHDNNGVRDLRQGEAYVTMLLQQIMKSSSWGSTMVFLAWDDWGGYYDHVRPPIAPDGRLMYGVRVPAMVISPWLGIERLDHQTLSFDAYLKLMEDLFVGGNRLSGDGRTDVRENEAVLGDLLDEFDFNLTPLPAPPAAVTGLACKFSSL
jgi:phospholipase C